MSHVKILGLVLGVVLVLSCSAFGAKARSYASTNYFLTIDANQCGFPKSVEGGAITAEVINEPAGPNYFVKKHIGQPKYQDFQVQVSFDMTRKVGEWIARSWFMGQPRVNGSFTTLDDKLQPAFERQFFNALLTETTIPALDSSSKEPAYLTLKFAPEYTRTGKLSGKSDYSKYAKDMQKVFLPANFKLEIAGLDCSKVNRIESFTVRQTAVTDDIGDARDYAKEPGKLEFPNLKITLAESTAQSWLDWHENFVVKGNNDETLEKNGTLTLLAPDRQKVLAQIKFYNMGIFLAQPDTSEANADQIKRVQVQLYVERMEFLPEGKAVGPGTTAASNSGTTSPPKTTPPAPPRTLVPSAPKNLKRPG